MTSNAADALLSTLASRRVLLANDDGALRFRAPEGALDAQLRDRLRSHKGGLLAALRDRPGFVQLCPPSYNQVSLFLLHLFDPRSPAYNLAVTMRLAACAAPSTLRSALARLAGRHAQLRTTLGHVVLDDRPVLSQFVASELPPTLEEIDARGATDAELREQARAFYRLPINLEKGPLLQAALFTRGPADQVLGVKMHHVAADGWSLRVVIRDLGRHYREALEGQPVTAEQEPGAYIDYCLEQREFLELPAGSRQMEYWRAVCSPPPAGLELEGSRPRPAVRRAAGATRYFDLEPALVAQLEGGARKLGVTLFAVLLAAFEHVLLRRSGQGEVVVGIPTLGRRGQKYEDTVGYFVNPVPLRSRRLEALGFAEHVQRTARELTEALDNRDAPFAAVVEALGGTRDPGRTPVFQVLFNLLSRRMLGEVVDLIYPGGDTVVDFGGLPATAFALDQQEGQFDLTLEFVERGAGLLGLFKYCTDLFDAGQAAEMVEEIRQLLAQVAQDFEAVRLEAPRRLATGSATPTPAATRVVVAATFTAEPMKDAFSFWFERLGWQAEVAFSPFNQVHQSLLDPGSVLRQNAKGFGVVLLRLDDLIGGVENAGASAPKAGVAERLRANLDELADAIADAAGSVATPLCVAVCPSSPQLRAGIDEEQLIAPFLARLETLQGVRLLTPAALNRWYPVAEYYEPAGEELGHIPYTPAFLTALATGVVRTLQAVRSRPVKALVLDCDGTLWDGVVGEDGPEGVLIGEDARRMHAFLREQAQAGVVLCLCSKNQEADVWSVFERHPHTLLKRDDFTFWRINWHSKSGNIRELADEIGIGLDAMAFFDDNPLEREDVRSSCPSVLCPDLPADWAERVALLQHLWPLDRARVTEDDRRRIEHYRSERARADLQRCAGSLGDFLERLQLQIDIHPAQASEYERLAQLSMRTNQFNTTTCRMDAREVADHTAPGHLACSARVRDRFGDYGLVGAAFATTHASDSTLAVDLLLLSCRALGRGVEYVLVSWLAEQAAAAGCAWLEFGFRPTERNEPARLFLGRLEERCAGTRSDGGLRIRTDALIGIRYVPEATATSTPRTAPDATPRQAPEALAAQWDEGLVGIATDLRTPDSIVAAVDERRRRERTGLHGARHSDGPATAPANETERVIAEVWRKVLAVDTVGTSSNFFEAGGSSLLAAQVAVALRRHGFTVTIVDMLHYPTIASLARHLNPEAEAEVVAAAARDAPPVAQEVPAAFARLRRHRGR